MAEEVKKVPKPVDPNSAKYKLGKIAADAYVDAIEAKKRGEKVAWVSSNFPVEIPETEDPATNMYDMRLTAHEDGWIYGIFCVERYDETAPAGDLSRAKAAAGIVRTSRLRRNCCWE